MEAFFLGDLAAVATAYEQPKLLRYQNKREYRDADAIDKPAQRLFYLVPGYRKREGARRIAPLLSAERSRSKSFCALVRSLEQFASA